MISIDSYKAISNSNEKLDAFWNILLQKDSKGRTLYGLLQATSLSCDNDLHICALVPEAFSSVEDLTAFAVAEMFRLNIIDRFDVERGGSMDNFTGYLAARAKGRIRNALQDALRAKSVDLRGQETPDMIEQGKHYGRYTPVRNESMSHVSPEDTMPDANIKGSVQKDWSACCEWDVANRTELPSSDVFLQNLLWELSPEEAEAALRIVNKQKIENKTTHATLIKQARTRLNRLGISPKLILEGAIV